MIEQQLYEEALLNVYLNVSKEASDLTEIAYAKAILWVLYMENRSLDLATLIDKVSDLMGVISIPEESAKSSVALLSMQGKVEQKNGNAWKLPPKYRMLMEGKLKNSEEITKKILLKRFPTEIKESKLRAWFMEANKTYFSVSANELIALYNKKEKLIFKVETVIRPTVKKFGLEKYESELLQGYREFLTSDDKDEEERVFNLVQAVLAGKLVSANLCPDILNISKYKNSEIILDTNILLAFGLFNKDGLINALKAFGTIISQLGIKLYVAEFTIEEYEKVRTREKDNFLKLIEYDSKILEGIKRKDDFTESIIKTGCKTEEDVERFFNEGLKLPEKIGDAEINILGGDDLIGSEVDETKDVVLINKIQEAWNEKRGSKKPNLTAIHDARLEKLVKKLSKDRNIFALTLDTTMEAFSLKGINEKCDPTWRSLYSLIQILAINGGGPNFEANDLAPLIKVFFKFEEAAPCDNSYDKRDLLLLIEKTERIKELPTSRIISLLNQHHRAVFANSTSTAMHEFSLELDRSLRKNEHVINQSIKERDSKILDLTEDNEIKKTEIKALRDKNKDNEIKIVWMYFMGRLVIFILCAYFLFLYLKDDLSSAIKNQQASNIVEILFFVITPVIWAVGDYFGFTKDRISTIGNRK